MLSKTTVLLVEDSAPDAKFVQQLLPKEKFEIVHVLSLSAATRIMSEEPFDVVLLDLSLPDGSGLASFQAVKEIGSKTPVVILTGLNDDETALMAVKLGAQDYIQKIDVNASFLERSIHYAIERKAAEETEKKLATYEQREEFMATLTHDLKNPLIGTNRVLELLAEQAMGEVSPEHAELLLQIRESNKILLAMIQNLLDVYRFEKDMNAVVLTRTYLKDILSTCLKDILPIAENRKIKISTDYSNAERLVQADFMAMRRVFQNLLDNAIKFTPPGGEITLRVAPIESEVCVEIQDNGPGMSVEEKAKIFQRFSQGRAGRKFSPGTGLGLFLCKKIVEAHSGQISCESEEGSGTKFLVCLPAA